MNEIVDLVAGYSVWAILGAALLFGAAPSLVAHVVVLIYPRDHPRRAELLAELHEVPYRERLVWVASQAIAVIFEGLPLRLRSFRNKRARQIVKIMMSNGKDTLVSAGLLEEIRSGNFDDYDLGLLRSKFLDPQPDIVILRDDGSGFIIEAKRRHFVDFKSRGD